MKKMIQLIVIGILSATLLVSCTSPIKNYQNTVDEAGIEISLNEIKESIGIVHESFAVFFNNLEVSLTKQTNYEGLNKSKELLDGYMVQVKDTIKKAEAMDTSKKEVKVAHENLMKALYNYEQMGESLNSVVFLSTQFFSLWDTLYAKNEALNALDKPSQEYSDAIYAFMLSNASVLEELSAFDYNNLLTSEDINSDTLRDMKVNVTTLLKGLVQMPVVTEVDKTYNDLLNDIYSSTNNMIDIFVLNIETVIVISNFKGPGSDDSLRVELEDVDVWINKWKEALKK